MEIEIKNKTENKVLARDELTFTLTFEKAVPSRKDVRAELAKKVGCDEKLLVVDAMKCQYGTQEAVCTARIYKEEKGVKVERRYMLVRNSLAEKKAKKVKQKAAPAAKKK